MEDQKLRSHPHYNQFANYKTHKPPWYSFGNPKSHLDLYEQMEYDYYNDKNRPSNPDNCWVRPSKKEKGGFASEVTYKKIFRSSSTVILIMWRTNIDRQLGNVCRKMPKSLINGTKYTVKVGEQSFLTAAEECKNKLKIIVDNEEPEKHNESLLKYVKLAVIQYNHVKPSDFNMNL